jgi:hypothetical protein
VKSATRVIGSGANAVNLDAMAEPAPTAMGRNQRFMPAARLPSFGIEFGRRSHNFDSSMDGKAEVADLQTMDNRA